MLDVGWSELFVIAVVALIVIGPKDLPHAMRAMAKVVGKVRGLSREFQQGVTEIMQEGELDELRRKMNSATKFDVRERLKDIVDPSGNLTADFNPADLNFGYDRPTPTPPSTGGQPSSPMGPPPPPPAAPLPQAAPGVACATDAAEVTVASAPASSPPSVSKAS